MIPVKKPNSRLGNKYIGGTLGNEYIGGTLGNEYIGGTLGNEYIGPQGVGHVVMHAQMFR